MLQEQRIAEINAQLAEMASGKVPDQLLQEFPDLAKAKQDNDKLKYRCKILEQVGKLFFCFWVSLASEVLEFVLRFISWKKSSFRALLSLSSNGDGDYLWQKLIRDFNILVTHHLNNSICNCNLCLICSYFNECEWNIAPKSRWFESCMAAYLNPN